MRYVDNAELITGLGLDGDKHAVASSNRQVLLVDQEALDEVGLGPGIIKENLTVEGFNVMGLPVGTRIRLGAHAVLEITEICKPCFRMDEIRLGLQDELAGRRGMNSRVILGGPISAGDRIAIEEAEPLAS